MTTNMQFKFVSFNGKMHYMDRVFLLYTILQKRRFNCHSLITLMLGLNDLRQTLESKKFMLIMFKIKNKSSSSMT